MKRTPTYQLLLLAIWLTYSCFPASAQLTVSGTKTPAQLVEDVLLGTGVQVFNISYTGSNLARGEFDGVNANIGFDAGVLLASGRITNAIGPNNQANTSTNFGLPGDADLDGYIAPLRSADAAVLEFDFRVPADTIFFDYVFASEEYPEFAPPNSSAFSDAFAFLLTGPNPAGGTYNNVNLAVIPGTSTTVEINNVNPVSNAAFYINNGNGNSAPQNTDPTVVEYDGFTVPLTATSAVVPCATYHIKLVVADGYRNTPDRIYDSGVFLKANSFGANINNPTIDFISTAPACDGDVINFLNTGTSSAGILYSWNFGADATPATSLAENPTGVTYSTPGLKLVNLEMNINCGDTTLSFSKGIAIDEKPVPGFTSTAPQCEQEAVDFTYTGSTGQNWTYAWDFGAGASPSTSFAQNPTGIAYNTPGTKTVTLTVTNGNCLQTITQNITINDRPTASFSNTGPVGIGYGVDFTNTGTSGASYLWNFGAGANPTTSGNENPSGITYSASGTKTISLITSMGGCSDTTLGIIEILTTPNPSFTSNAPQPVGFPILFTYTGNTDPNFTFTWDFGSGAQPSSSNSASPAAVYYNTPGVKTITLTVTNGSITITITQTITIDQPPVAAFTSTAPNCEGVGIDFSNSGTVGATYNWNFGTDATPATSTQQNPLGVVYSSPGFKTVRLITTLSGDNDTSEATIYIIPQPKPNFTHNGPQCEGTPINFTYSGNVGTGWTFLWDFGNGSVPNISSNTSPTGILYNSPGDKVVQLSVSNSMCAASDTQTVTINPSPDAGVFTASSACTGSSINVGNTGTSGLSYNWNLGSGATPGTSLNENPIVVYSTKGIKHIQQIVTQGACSDTSSTTISIVETPSISSITGPSNICQNAPANTLAFDYIGTTANDWTYTWDFGTTAQPTGSNIRNPSGISYLTSGTKTVVLRVANKFCLDSANHTLAVDTVPTSTFNTNAPVCESDTLRLQATALDPNFPNLSYAWRASNSGVDLQHLDTLGGAAVYNLFGIKNVGLYVQIGNCADSSFLDVTINDKPDVSISSTAPQCQGEEVAFYNLGSSGSNWKYNWDFGSNALPSIATSQNVQGIHFKEGGKQKITLRTSDSECFNTDTLTIDIHNLPVTNAGTDTIICADDCLQLGDASKVGHSYQWFPASLLDNAFISNPELCPSAEFTSMILTETIDSTSCVNRDTVTISMLTSAIADAGSDVETCFGDSVQIGAAIIKGQQYIWSPSNGLSNAASPSPMASPDTTTVYNVQVSYKGCETIQDVVKVVVRRAIANAGPDVKIAKGEKATLNASGGITFEWSPSTYLNNPFIANPISEANENITYVVKVEDVFNCVDWDTVNVAVVNPNLFIPNTFTPNQSGKNDIFRVRGSELRNFEFTVFNRAGSMVYFSTDFHTGWDGNNQQTGEVMPTGAYIYRVIGTDESGEAVNLSGIVNLIR